MLLGNSHMSMTHLLFTYRLTWPDSTVSALDVAFHGIVCVYGESYCCIIACTHLGNSTGCRTSTMAAPLLLIIGPERCETVLHSCGTSRWGGGYQLVKVRTHSDYIVLPNWDIS